MRIKTIICMNIFVKNILKIAFSGVSALAVFFAFKIVMPSVVADKVMFLVPLAASGIVYLGMLWLFGIVKMILGSKGEKV